jgi:hypothetical protein
MKIKVLSIACLLSLVCTAAMAQSAQPYSSLFNNGSKTKPISSTNKVGKLIQAQVACDPAEDEDCPDQPAAPTGPPPAVPTGPSNSAQYEQPGKDLPGRIKIMVTTPRHFNIHLGEIMPVQMQIQTDDAVIMNFDLLKRGKFKAGGTDSNFQLVKDEQGVPIKPVIEAAPSTQVPHTIVYKITMYLQYMQKLDNTPMEVPFNIDLSYALDPPKDPKKLKDMKWGMLTTPDMVFSMVTTADNGKTLLEGDGSLVQIRTSWAAYPLLFAGVLFIFWNLVGFALARVFTRVKVAMQKPLEYQVWKVFNKVFADSVAYGEFTPKMASKVALALRRYFSIKPGSTITQIKSQHADAQWMPQVVAVVTKLETVMFTATAVILSVSEIDELKTTITALVPKTPAPKAKK